MPALHLRTPLIESTALSSALGASVFLKLDCLQPTGSFKIRGLGHSCQASRADGASMFLSSSGGNAGLAVAYAGRHLGVPVTIVVPGTTSPLMQDRLRAEGATVIQHGAAWDDAHAYAMGMVGVGNAVYMHPFDDPRVWVGHASLVHEIKEQGLHPDLVVTVVGGGGLLCGILQGLHEVGWADVPVVAVETEGASSFAQSIEASRLITLERIASLATSLGARTVCQRALDWTREHQIVPLVVSDRSAVAAVLRFADDHRLLVEPACGAALAAVYERAPVLTGARRVLVVVCGGAGVTRELLARWVRQVGLEL